MAALPRITIITPSYNQGKFIGQTIESVLSQNYPNLEYIVMDGGSTDETIEILKRYRDRLYWISERDRGQSHAINKGLQRATGEVIGYLNTDDLYEPDALMKVGEFFARHPEAAWITGKCRVIDQSGQSARCAITLYRNMWLRLKSRMALQLLNYIPQPATFWRRRVIDETGFFDETLRYAMDYDYSFRVICQFRLWVLNDCLASFRVHPTSITGSSPKGQFKEDLEVTKRYVSSPIFLGLHMLHNTMGTIIYEASWTRRKKPTSSEFSQAGYPFRLSYVKPMRIGLNLLFLIPGEVGGTETYTTSIIKALGVIDNVNEYFLLINWESKCLKLTDCSNFQRVICPIRAQSRLMRFFWEQCVLPWQARRLRLDIVHSLGYISPLFLPCKAVVTIHDLNFLDIPEAFTRFTQGVQQFFVTHSANRADSIIAVSGFVCDQIVTHLKVSREKVIVVHEAPKQRSVADPDESLWCKVRHQYSIHQPYILALSSLSPHKNMPRLLEAFARVQTELGDNCHLVVAGHLPSKGVSLPSLAEELGLNKSVTFTSYLPDEHMSLLLSHAALFVFPSMYEGFGLPLLEAMAAGTPVACSSKGSLSEIAGDAAAFFDPTNIQEMADVLCSLMRDETRRHTLRERGRKNLGHFSWELAARKTLAVYNLLMSAHPKENAILEDSNCENLQ